MDVLVIQWMKVWMNQPRNIKKFTECKNYRRIWHIKDELKKAKYCNGNICYIMYSWSKKDLKVGYITSSFTPPHSDVYL